MDAAGIVPMSDGGYVYISNSENDSPKGGVFGLYFDRDGESNCRDWFRLYYIVLTW